MITLVAELAWTFKTLDQELFRATWARRHRRSFEEIAVKIAAAWMLLTDGLIDRSHQSDTPAPLAVTLRRARSWVVCKTLVYILIGDAGVRGCFGGKAAREPPAHAALQAAPRLAPNSRRAPRPVAAVADVFGGWVGEIGLFSVNSRAVIG
jgi:hypothetical protein